MALVHSRVRIAAALVAWSAACDSNERMAGPDAQAPEAAFLAIVSNPVAIAASGGPALAAAAAAEVAYVSLPPGTIPGGEMATIANRQTGATVTTPVVGGGFDPVLVVAQAGDTLQVEVRVGGGATPVRAASVVPPRRRPIVVRTDPPPGKRDVPLNASIVIVFSEPIDPATLNGSSIQVLQNGLPVAGELGFVGPSQVIAEFVPAEPLLGAENYELRVSQEIRDLDGEALETALVVEFSTESPPQPDGGQIAFTSTLQGKAGIYLVNADGSGLVRVTDDSGWAMDPVWSPDGTRLAYRSDRDGYRSDWEFYGEIYVHGPGGPERLTNLEGPEVGIVWSPDGLRIAFVTLLESNFRDGAVQVMNADGSGLKELTADHQFVYARPEWSPDGLRLVVQGRSVWDYGHGISTMRADGSEHTGFPYGGEYPTWSPDGRKIAYVRYDRGIGLSIMNADGSENTLITSLGYVTSPRWSPDGTKIVIVDNDEYYNGDIYVVNANGAGLRRVTPPGVSFSEPAWSPDGRKIAFSGWSNGRSEIYVVNADGSGLTQLTHSPFGVSNWAPVWRPRGRAAPPGSLP